MDLDEYCMDEWPTMPDGSDFDGKDLLALVRNGQSPFLWDVELLIREVENNLGASIIDIPIVTNGANSLGICMELSNSMTIVARLGQQDVNMPRYRGFPLRRHVMDIKFSAAVYKLLDAESQIPVSRLLYHRIPVQHAGPHQNIPQDILGRCFLLFEKAEGENNVWKDLSEDECACLLDQAAHIRASLFNFDLPSNFAAEWFLDRLFEHKPESLPAPMAPTREFWEAVLVSKVKATIRNLGDMIGWESDNETVGPIALTAKQSLLRLIPHIMPADDEKSTLYRIVLEHGDYGIHNMTISMDSDGQPLITSLYDWDTGCIVPALLSNPSMSVWVDLVTDEDAAPTITRIEDEYAADPEFYEECMCWTRQYFKVLFDLVPDYEHAIKAGKDVRHIWFALQDWRGKDPERYFGQLGTWAENRMKELGIV